MTEIKIDNVAIATAVAQMKNRNVAGTADLALAHVTIAGAGGLGSNIAIVLARSGVGHLTLIDFDVVDYTNLNRQQYKVSQVGMPKVLALKQNILEFNPFITIDTLQTRVTYDNVATLFESADVMCEAFDNPESKAILLQAASDLLPDKPLVMGNGMAGLHSANTIRTKQIRDNVYICGDGESQGVEGLMAPRVIICAGHQANLILQLLVDQVMI